MKDAYDRRTLLLHLGSTLETVSQLIEIERGDKTIGELIRTQPALAEVPLLQYVFDGMTVSDFTAATLRAYCGWPRRLLDQPLDRAALAISVRDHLFATNPVGWDDYAAALRTGVAWFGDGLPDMGESQP